MAKARVYGSNAQIFVKHPVLQTDIQIGEVDSFSARQKTNLITSRPIGKSMEKGNLIYGGWELDFRGGKIDWKLADTIHNQDMMLRMFGYFPTFTITQKIIHYDGTIEEYNYPDTIIYGYEIGMDGAMNELGESFKGFSSTRDKGLFGLGTDVGALATNLIGEIVANVAVEAAEEAANTIGNALGF